MRYKFLVNTLQIFFSGFMIFAFQESLSVSGPKPNYLSFSAIPVILAYFIAYLFITVIERRYNQLLNIVSLLSISLVGSFIFCCYEYLRLINGAWSNHLEDVERLLVPALITGFFMFSIIFFLISGLLTGCIWIKTDGFKIMKQTLKYK